MVKPTAVAFNCISPPKEFSCPESIPKSADSIVEEHSGADEITLTAKLFENLSFNESQLAELEKATRGQSVSKAWREQRKGCITGSKVREIFTKVNSISKARSQQKITPLVSKCFKDFDFTRLDAIKYGQNNEDNTRKSFFETEGKKHKNPKLLVSGLLAHKQLPYIRVTPDNIFSCSCCPDSPFTVEYKCPYKIKEKPVAEGWQELNYLCEIDGKPSLLKSHKYYSQVMLQMGVKGASNGYFMVWTPTGEPLIQKLMFDTEHFHELERNAVIFFKSYIIPVLLKVKEIWYCPSCGEPCLEEGEINRPEEQSVKCTSCSLWYHYPCAGIRSDPCNIDNWLCNGCTECALVSDTESKMFIL